MFTSITWQEYITTVSLVVGAYYFISAWLLYHQEIIHWYKSRIISSPGQTPESSPSRSVMGDISKDDSALRGSSTIVAEEIIISATSDESEAISSNGKTAAGDIIIGSVADLLQELKNLVQLISEGKMSKEESQTLFNALLIRYPELFNTFYQEAISLYICEAVKNQLSFELQYKEVATWWKLTK